MWLWFNITACTPHFSTTGVNHLLNPFIDALNANAHLPDLVLVIPDGDLLKNLKVQNNCSAMTIGASLHYLIKQMDIVTQRRKQDLNTKRPGALKVASTKFIWVRMLRRPPNDSPRKADIFALRGKFNTILEQRLLDGDAANHHIISIDVPAEDFDFSGLLTETGKRYFWKELDKGLQRFLNNDITLKLRVMLNGPSQKFMKSTVQKVQRTPTGEWGSTNKLPTPPPKKVSSKDRQPRRSRSRPHHRSGSHIENKAEDHKSSRRHHSERRSRSYDRYRHHSRHHDYRC